MLLLTIPRIFFTSWFWIAMLGVITVIHYFFGKAPPPPKKSPFFEKHKRTITRVSDIFLVLVIVLGWAPSTYVAVSIALDNPVPFRENIMFAVTLFCTGAIHASGMTGALVGCLSIFWANLGKGKRFTLLGISLLPILFTGLIVLTDPFEEPEHYWPVAKSGLISLLNCWLINGPAIIAGQHFIRVAWLLMRKLKLVSGEFPE